ncbi:MAG TPA: ABC transporter ATP-binding protein [Polyangiaceae bacterium]|nr:ABC transporter ATP-binding protein [Polyangiaceae bacterium]
MSAVLKVRGLRKEFETGSGRIVALRDVAFDVNAGEIVCIVGPSGSGKSTLLAMVAGLDAPTAGHILLDDEPVLGPGSDRGMVFQKDCLFPWLTVEQNVAFATALARHKRSDPEAAAERARSLILAVGLGAFKRALPRQLSGGMRQRAAIARALLCQPRILLMDEPFGALDAQTREQMQDLLLGLCGRGETTVLFVTHDVEEAVFLGDRVIVLSAHPGEIAAEIPVVLPRPRELEQKLDPEFSRVRREVVTALRAARREAAA